MIYLDNSATTKPCEQAIEMMRYCMQECWGNPSSLSLFGMNAEAILSDARSAAARLIGAKENEIFFTSGGTEANNMVLRGVAAAKAKRGKRIVVSSVEHHCVLDTARELKKIGFEVIELPVEQNGKVSVQALEHAIDNTTILVSLMLVNNETGAIQPVSEAARIIREKNAPALLHTDAVQAFGKMPIHVSRLGVDFLTASAHKIHGPKGAGILYKRKDIFLPPLITGGGQESGLRSGTEAVPAIAGMLGAMKALPEPSAKLARISSLRDAAVDRLKATGIVEFNSPADAFPYLINLSVPGYRSETLLHFLEEKGILVSSGSACSKGKSSHVLAAMGLDKRRIDSALRISFSRDTQIHEIDALARGLTEASERLRKSE